MHQEHRFWHQAKQGSCLLHLCLSLLSEDSTRHTPQLWAQVRKRQLEMMKTNHLPLTPEPCHSPGGSQGWDRNNSPGRNCATGTVRKLLACFGGSRVDVPFLQKKAERGDYRTATIPVWRGREQPAPRGFIGACG